MLKRLITRYWLLVPVLLLVVIAVDRIETPIDEQVEETLNMRETRSDYYLESFISQRFGEGGALQYIVQGDTLAHYPDDNRSEIVSPSIQLNRPLATWQIESQQGRFDPEPDQFTLQGNVSIRRTRDGEDPINMQTDSLTVQIKNNQVSSQDRITINAQNWQIRANAMRSALDDGTLALDGKVEARYEVEDGL